MPEQGNQVSLCGELESNRLQQHNNQPKLHDRIECTTAYVFKMRNFRIVPGFER